MSRRFTTRLAAVLCASAVMFASACASNGNDATSPSSSQDSSAGENAVASNGEGEGGEQGSATGSEAVDLLSDDAVAKLFGEQFLQTCDVGDGFYVASHLAKNVRVIEPNKGTVLNRDPKCSGYVKTDDGEAYAYMEVNLAKNAQAQLVRAQPGMEAPKDPALGDWRESHVGPVNLAGMCTLLAPPKMAIAPIYISVAKDCSLAYPLARSFQDLSVRYERSKGRGDAGDYVGTGGPADVQLISDEFTAKLKDAKPFEEAVTTTVDGEEVQGRLTNIEVVGDDSLRFGAVCFDLELDKGGKEYDAKDLSGFHVVQADGTPIQLEKESSGTALCTREAMSIANTDFFVGNYEEDSVSKGVKMDDITPLWRAKTQLGGDPFTIG